MLMAVGVQCRNQYDRLECADIPAAPVILVNEHLNTVVIEADDALTAEKDHACRCHRHGTVLMSALYVMSGKQSKSSSVQTP